MFSEHRSRRPRCDPALVESTVAGKEKGVALVSYRPLFGRRFELDSGSVIMSGFELCPTIVLSRAQVILPAT